MARIAEKVMVLLNVTGVGPVASAVLLERERIRTLWVAVENAGDDDFDDAYTAFRIALGLLA